MQFNESDFNLLKREAKKLGLEIVRKTDIPKGEEYNYVDLSDINIFDAICLPYDYSELLQFDVFTATKGQAA